ncbi:MAG: AI-2E family transporter [Lachnospiraceae bacterium]|nr:AI-2E family transporter [Lachnospiraceae bacterium]
MKNEGNHSWWRTKYGQLCLALIIASLAYLVFSHMALIAEYISAILAFFSPVVIGVVIAYALDPFCTFFEVKFFGKMRNTAFSRGLAVALTVFLTLAGMSLLLVSVVPQIVGSISTLTTNARRYVYLINQQLDKLSIFARDIDIDLSQFSSTMQDMMGNVLKMMSSGDTSLLNTGASIGMGLYNVIISFIISIYVLADKRRLLTGFKYLMSLIVPEKIYVTSSIFWSHCNKILIRFIIYDLLDGLIVGVANYIFMSFSHLPYSALISVVVGVTNMAPTFGPVAGGVIGSIILVFVNHWYAVWFIIFTVVLQTLDGYIIKPKLFGNSLGVPSIAILISIILCGNLMGVWGVLLGIPIAAILDYLYHDYILPRLEKNRDNRLNREHETHTPVYEEQGVLEQLFGVKPDGDDDDQDEGERKGLLGQFFGGSDDDDSDGDNKGLLDHIFTVETEDNEDANRKSDYKGLLGLINGGRSGKSVEDESEENEVPKNTKPADENKAPKSTKSTKSTKSAKNQKSKNK